MLGKFDHRGRREFSVVSADKDQYGTQKENILIALDAAQEVLGMLCIYPFFAYDTEPEHPHNVYLHFRQGGQVALSKPVKDVLLEHALQRAAEIKHEAGQTKTRVYACFFAQQEAEIAYFESHGFVHDEGMYILERDNTRELPSFQVPEGVAFQSWRMETGEEQQKFIETHRTIFPRHPYSKQKIQELKNMRGWNNFTGFSDEEIVGNIMVYTADEKRGTGYIEDLFVQKDWRRQGVAKHLLAIALRYFQSEGFPRVQLEMWSANKPALNLYRGYGFVMIRETEIGLGRYV